MDMRERPSIRFALESFQKYQRNEIDIAALENGLGNAASLLENDIPKPVRDAIEWAYNQVEHIGLVCPEDQEREKIASIWREVEEVISRNVQLNKDDE